VGKPDVLAAYNNKFSPIVLLNLPSSPFLGSVPEFILIQMQKYK